MRLTGSQKHRQTYSISSELAEFLGEEPGVRTTKHTVIHLIMQYISAHGLCCVTEGAFVVDEALRKLFRRDRNVPFGELFDLIESHFHSEHISHGRRARRGELLDRCSRDAE